MKNSIYPIALSLVLGGQAIAQDAADGASGLKLTMQQGAASDVRVSRQAALTVQRGESVSALLPAGQYAAVWEGHLKIDKRSRVYFSFEGNGSAELFVDGESVLKEEGKFGGDETKRLRLSSGEVPVKIIYKSGAEGAGSFRLMWRGRDFAKEPVPHALLGYNTNEKLAQSQLVRMGRGLFAEMKCAACHDGGKGMPEASEMGPSLAGVGSRLDEHWMAEWVLDPSTLRQHARMPKVVESKEEAAHVAAYLATLKADGSAQLPEGDAAAGGRVFHQLGCISCHQTEQGQDLAKWGDGKPIELFNAGRKYQPGALAAFLKEPGKHHASTRMPDFNLSDKEASDLAAFVRGLDKLEKKQAGSADLAKGKELVKAAHCASCHDGLPQEAAAKTSFTALADLAKNGVKGCLTDEGKGPKYQLTDTEKKALAAFMQSEQAVRSLINNNRAEYAYRQFENLNCAACHTKDGGAARLGNVHALSAAYAAGDHKQGGHGTAPPDLTFVGEKLRTDWMEKLFKGELEYRTRPWLKQRMPEYHSRAKDLAEGLAAQYGVMQETTEVPAKDEPGKTLFGMQGGFGCAACHGAAEAKPVAVFEAPGVNLLYAGQRLRTDYYHRWMKDPRRIDPLTIMPKYFVEENTTTLAQPLDGDGQKQMEAILQWMKSLDQ
ncbi:hypothetical protein Rhal01_00900 [Rubritalea halochordaticola]|uniref:C-type cytochrome n=1 Tax=Rubritalea halochordaticola TaxID=714537 RepID=A0ABP9V0X7_9BACT